MADQATLEKIDRLAQELMQTISDFCDEETISVGNAMDALLIALVASAESSPNHDPAKFMELTMSGLRNKMGMQ